MNPKPHLILIGMKSSGKTTVGKILARKLGRHFTDMDAEVERLHFKQQGERLRFREIFKKHGKDYFRNLETAALQAVSVAQNEMPFVLATGGGLPLAEENRPLLKGLGTIVFLDVAQDVLLPRITSGARAIISAICARMSAGSPAPQRISIWILAPSVHFNS